MSGFDLTAARLVRLRQDIDALLAGDDPQTRQDIFQLLSIGTRGGLDLFPQFRSMLAPWLKASHDRAEPAGDGLEMAALPKLPRATLWPYRPKRLHDELLSSWLWRTAEGLGAPPKRFAIDAIGDHLADVDRDISDDALERLAFLSGQSQKHLRHGVLRPETTPLPLESRPRIRQVVMLYGDLVLQRYRDGRCVGPIVQYCPVCLARRDTGFLRCSGRFSFEVACRTDGYLLLDSCWKCGAAVNPLAQAIPASGFLCARCHAPLAGAPSVRIAGLAEAQDLICARIERLTVFSTVEFASPLLIDYLKLLEKSGLRGTNPANISVRVNAVLNEWERTIHDDGALRRKAGRTPALKKPAVTAQGQHRSVRRRVTNPATAAISEAASGLQTASEDEGRSIQSPVMAESLLD